MSDNPYRKFVMPPSSGGDAQDAAASAAPRNPYARFVKTPSDYSRMTLEQLDAEYKKQRAARATPEQLRGIADAYASKEWETKQDPASLASGFVTQALPSAAHLMARGVPFVGGALDEARAGAISAAGGDYDQALEFQRARDRHIDNNIPLISGAGQLAGGLFSGGLAMKALGWGGNVAQQSTRLLPTGKEVLKAFGGGSALGAADGFVRAEGEDRIPAIGTGAFFGGLLGAAAPYIGAGIGKLVNTGANLYNRNAHLRNLGLSPDSARFVLRTMNADDVGSEGVDRLRRAGPGAMLADAGPSAAALLDATIHRNGPGSSAALSAVNRRVTSATRDMRGLLNRTLGPATGVMRRKEAIYKATRPWRSGAYRATYNDVIDYSTPEGQELLGLISRTRPSYIREVNARLKEEGHTSSQIKVNLKDDGTIAFERMPDVKFIDELTRILNDEASVAGRTGANNNAGRITDLAKQMRDNLRTANPSYDTALKMGSIPIRLTEATKTGTKILDDNFTREMLERELRNIPDAERRAMQGGVRDALDERLGNIKKAIADDNADPQQLSAAIKLMSSDNNRQKMRMLLGPTDARRFFQKVDELGMAAQLKQRVRLGSQTNPRSVLQQGMRDSRDNSLANAVVSDQGRIVPLLRQKLSGRDPMAMLEADDAVSGEIANFLTQRRGSTATDFLPVLRSVMDTRNANRIGGVRAARKTSAGLLTAAPGTGNEQGSKRFFYGR